MSKITTPAALGPIATPASAAAPARTRTRGVWHSIRQAIAPLASLRVTIVLFSLALFLIFAGTLAQVHLGIWTAIKTYFRWWYVWIPFKIFFPPSWQENVRIPGAFPFPGGWTIGWALLINLLAAHLVRFRLTWRRSGILILHAGIVVLMVGEWLTGNYASEWNMRIDEGAASSVVVDNRHPELAVISSYSADKADVVVVPGSLIRSGGRFSHAELPFDLQVNRWMVNSIIPKKMAGPNPATEGLGLTMMAEERPEVVGTDTEQKADAPSAYVTLYKKGTNESLGTWLFSVHLAGDQTVTIDGKTYNVALRFKEAYKPYSVYLKSFTHEYYPGTQIPKNFASLVRIHDPTEPEVREVLIWMNHPFFYKGDAFYQSSFDEGVDTKSTTLQVVHNIGWPLPYIACIMVAAGMLIHFGFSLESFLRKKLAAAAIPAPAAGPSDSADTPKPGVLAPVRAGNGVVTANQAKHISRKGVSLSKPSRRGSLPAVETAVPPTHDLARYATRVTLALGVLYFLVAMWPPSTSPDRLQFDKFAGLPVQAGGRVKPVDTLARTTLYAVSGREYVTDLDGNSFPAVKWVLDIISTPSTRLGLLKDPVVRIANEQVLSFLQLEPRSGYRYSLKELVGKLDKVDKEVDRIQSVPPADRDLFDVGILQLEEKLGIIAGLQKKTAMIPPPAGRIKWRTFNEAAHVAQAGGDADPAVLTFGTLLMAYADRDTREFNKAVAAYQQVVAPDVSATGASVGFELFFNNFNPFVHCQVLYIIAFLMGCISWMAWSRPLGRAAFWLTVLTLAVHSWAIFARMWIQGRPPVTNLYSSAIFIGWVCAVMCLVLELIYRNGIGTVVAAFSAGAATILSLYLIEGDTLEMMRAVLDTNVWLATHVTCVTIGYAATMVAGVLGITYLMNAYMKGCGVAISSEWLRTISMKIYGVVCFAMLFSFTGTVLGGIWADQSWGRFWGWDPKENGAVLIVIWNALILHARWGGFARERGIAILSVLGVCVTLWSYFGTNMLGIGLHSYASAGGVVALLITEAILVAIAIGGLFIPPREKLMAG
jgi:ABC-type transport system involved in cytochrome c biogenesis permease subunit